MVLLKRSSHWYLLHHPTVFRWQVHKLQLLYFVHTSVSPQQFLHTRIMELPADGMLLTMKQPHPIKMLKSEYLNCSRALICVLEKFLNFVSLPTDFTVQVLSRKKTAVKHCLEIYQCFLLCMLLHEQALAVRHCNLRDRVLK